MKALYFDCSSGISGNMVLGALLEIINDEQYLIDEIKKLNITGYGIEISKKVKNGITGTYVDVILEEKMHNHNHIHDHTSLKDEYHHEYLENDNQHHHHHEHRNLDDVTRVIDNSSLNENVRRMAKRVFLRVAEAESKVHNKPIEEVHFHEVGAIDSIIDIVGTAILIDKINPDKIISSVVSDGYGFIECAHGTISVPVPATLEIFSNANVKFKQIDIDTELVTPTGAAIIAELAEEFSAIPEMSVKKIGWGCGLKDIKIPNVLKVYLGDVEQKSKDIVAVMETNIDDCSGEILGYTSEKLFKNGALDAFYTPIFMKKNRPAYRLTTVCKIEDMKKLENIIFTETTTIGIRYRYEERSILQRELKEIDTEYGTIKVKKVVSDGECFIYPEYESLKQIAEERKIPLKDLYKIDFKKYE